MLPCWRRARRPLSLALVGAFSLLPSPVGAAGSVPLTTRMDNPVAIEVAGPSRETGTSLREEEKALFTRMNAARANENARRANLTPPLPPLPPLVLDPALSRAAHLHAQEMMRTGILRHSGRYLRDLRCVEAGFPYEAVYRSERGENVAWHPTRSVEGVHNGFMRSTNGHREAVLNPAYLSAGVSFLQANNGFWVVQIFVGATAQDAPGNVREARSK